MTDERIARLTELARKVWPDRNVSAVVGDNMDEIGAGIIADADEDWAQLVIVENHPRALDALEAALRVLAGEQDTCPVHGDQAHGGEAEQLRAGIERIVQYRQRSDYECDHGLDETISDLNKLVDDVDARDSLAWIERHDEKRKGQLRELQGRADKAERELAELRASLPGPLATWFRVEAFALVERELREHELTVSVGGNPEHFVIVWEGDHPTGLTLLQAVDQLEEERDA